MKFNGNAILLRRISKWSKARLFEGPSVTGTFLTWRDVQLSVRYAHQSRRRRPSSLWVHALDLQPFLADG